MVPQGSCSGTLFLSVWCYDILYTSTLFNYTAIQLSCLELSYLSAIEIIPKGI